MELRTSAKYRKTFSELLNAYFQEFRGWTPADAVQLVGLSYLIGSIGYVFAAFVGEFYLKRRNVSIIWAWLGSLAVNLGIAFGPLALSYAVQKSGGNWNLAYTLCGILPIFVSGLFFLTLPAEAQGIKEDEI